MTRYSNAPMSFGGGVRAAGKWSVYRPGTQCRLGYADAFVPQGFFLEVVSHAACVLRGNRDPAVAAHPLFLVIEGEPGTGKTFQSIASCIQAGLTVLYCSASKLTGAELGASADALTELHGAAARIFEGGENPVIVLDDFHLGEASVGSGVYTTVNSNLLTGRLMNLCDDGAGPRIPFVLTANRISDVEPALLRHGRARRISWNPNVQEKREIVAAMYRPDRKGRAELDRFVEVYGRESISFFSGVLVEARRLAVAESLESAADVPQVVAGYVEKGLRSEKRIDWEDIWDAASLLSARGRDGGGDA